MQIHLITHIYHVSEFEGQATNNSGCGFKNKSNSKIDARVLHDRCEYRHDNIMQIKRNSANIMYFSYACIVILKYGYFAFVIMVDVNV